MLNRILLLSFAAVSLALGQNGDKPGEVQASRVPPEKIPPAPILSPEEALKSFKVQKGFRIELVAAEPMVHDPVQIAFDPDGKLWVLEMRGYMPNADGVGEFEKVGSIAVLEDTDGDGRMDKRSVFLEGLVMPRALALINGGALVAEPPNLWFWRDTDGDGKADEKVSVAKDYAVQADPKNGQRANPEHSSNGLLLDIDNWIYSANHTTRFRLVDGEWKREPTIFRGQWGISQDNFGRLAYNSNSDQLRMDLVPSAYLIRNPFYRNMLGVNWQPQKSQEVWPARVNPGVNRGYQPKQLRDDGTLATYTAACSPLIYRGDNFPPECVGNAFICEPSGNFVRRNILTEQNGVVTAQNAYDKAEFLASMDERFRPVNLNNGPDGALYIVDLHRGIIQHRIYLTSYLRKQAESRNLQGPPGLGRIYRVVAEGRPLTKKPQMSKAPVEELVKTLSHPNGWWRDTAQRLLVEKSSGASIPLLKQAAVAKTTNVLSRLHAMWTLEGMGQLDVPTLVASLKTEQHTKIRAAAIRMSDPFLKGPSKDELLPSILAQTAVNHVDVQLQLAFTLGEVNDPKALDAMATLARVHGTNEFIRSAIVTGLGLREIEFAQRVLADANWKQQSAAREQLLNALARCVMSHGRGERVSQLLDVVAKADGWQQKALLDGMVAEAPAENSKRSKTMPAPRVKRVRLSAEPAALAGLVKSNDAQVKSRMARLDPLLVWPGKPGVEPEPPVKPLTAAQQARYETGKQMYAISCSACHQAHGFGMEGLAPPLVDSEWVMGPEKRLAAIVLHGVSGPLTVKGQRYDLDMPAHNTFDDEQLAAILTYIRREWEHTFDPIEPGVIKAMREANSKRDDSWKQEELLKIK